MFKSTVYRTRKQIRRLVAKMRRLFMYVFNVCSGERGVACCKIDSMRNMVFLIILINKICIWRELYKPTRSAVCRDKERGLQLYCDLFVLYSATIIACVKLGNILLIITDYYLLIIINVLVLLFTSCMSRGTFVCTKHVVELGNIDTSLIL